LKAFAAILLFVAAPPAPASDQQPIVGQASVVAGDTIEIRDIWIRTRRGG